MGMNLTPPSNPHLLLFVAQLPYLPLIMHACPCVNLGGGGGGGVVLICRRFPGGTFWWWAFDLFPLLLTFPNFVNLHPGDPPHYPITHCASRSFLPS